MSSSDQTSQVSELASKIQQFLSYQITSGGLTDASKESLTVATECIEQAFSIQKKPASNELLEIYNLHKNQQASSGSTGTATSGANPNANLLLQNLASTFLGAAGQGLLGGNAQTNAATSTPTATASTASTNTTTPSAPKMRKTVTAAEKMAAESFKNQGNELMKQNMHREAYDCYTQAINIDDNNAIYYSNRAAASSKLGDHQAALRDCLEAIEIDSTYSKAYGRLGLAYASLDDHRKARDAYLKAVELDPTNESYKNNLKIAEDQLAQQSGTNTTNSGGQATMINMLRNMMSNPEVMQMAMRSLQDPGMQNLFGLGVRSSAANAPQQTQQSPASATSADTTTEGANNQSGQQQSSTPNQSGNAQPAPGMNPMDLLNLTSRIAGSAAGNIDLAGAGQQLLSSMQQNNPDFVNSLRRMMDQAFTPPANNQNNNGNPPPGYS